MKWWSVRMRASDGGRHVSGAEGLYGGEEVEDAVRAYLERAMRHDRGEPDGIVITVERLSEEPRAVAALPVFTIDVSGVDEAWGFVRDGLVRLGVSLRALETALSVIESPEVMRGAALVRAGGGDRVEPDGKRGVRATRLGMAPSLRRVLQERLARLGADTSVVGEALALASKIASCPHVIAELCVSDDPLYTTGYISSAGIGYVRVPCLKRRGAMNGGRVFFLNDRAPVRDVVDYIEREAVMVSALSTIHDPMSPDEFFGSLDR